MSEFKIYRRKDTTGEMKPCMEGDDLSDVSIGEADRAKGSPKRGDFIARSSTNHDDLWLVSADYFADKFEPEPIADAD